MGGSRKRAQWPAAGYFTALMVRHNWPPGWQPAVDWGINHARASEIAAKQRAGQLAKGITGTIVGLSDKSDARLLAIRGPYG